MRVGTGARPHPGSTARTPQWSLTDERTVCIDGSTGARIRGAPPRSTPYATCERRLPTAAGAPLPRGDDAGAVRADALVQLPQLDPHVAPARSPLDRLVELPLCGDAGSDLPRSSRQHR